MNQSLNNFFLSGFKDASYFEKRKATYLFYILLSTLGFVVITTISQICIQLGPIYLTANLIALTGICLSLAFFKFRKVIVAGHLMAGSIMVAIAIETIILDSFSTDPAIRYRLYINFASLLGVYFIILSFFRQKKSVLWYAIASEVILAAHAFVIYHQIGSIPKMGDYTIEHFLAITIGMLIIAALCTWLLSYMEALFQQNMEYAERFKSQKEQLEKMVEQRTQALQTSNNSLREFAYIVSHDLKEPLRTISGFVTLIKKELHKQGLHENEIEEYIQFVTAGTHQMELLIDDILTYSKLNEAEKKTEVVNMPMLISMVKSRLAKSIYESDCDIYLTQIIPVEGDVAMLAELFENLLSNAIKYRDPERNLKITIGCTKEIDTVRYFVQDNGIGIAQQYFDTIFKAFRRLHSKKDYEGTGVGLAICKRIVEIHGGDMGVESTEGEGSTFWFTLPAAQTDVPAIQPVVQAL
jgi:signal transduction histidine kinase